MTSLCILQLDPKFLRNQRFAKKFNKKNENKSKKVRIPPHRSFRIVLMIGFTLTSYALSVSLLRCLIAGRISADLYWRSRMQRYTRCRRSHDGAQLYASSE